MCTQTCGAEPLPVRSDNLQVDGVRIELNCRTSSCVGDLLAVVRTHTHLTRSARSHVFCVSSAGHSQERNSSKELGFSLHRKEETEFILYREEGRENVKTAV